MRVGHSLSTITNLLRIYDHVIQLLDMLETYREPAWRYGYPLALLSMAAVAGGLLWFFRRKGWLGGARRGR